MILNVKKTGLILISGSMKFKQEMIDLSDKLKSGGYKKVIEPSDEIYINSMVVLDKAKNHAIFENLVEEADLLIVYNKNGYIGISTAMEIQKAMDSKVPVRLLCEPEAIEFKALCLHPNYDIKVEKF